MHGNRSRNEAQDLPPWLAKLSSEFGVNMRGAAASERILGGLVERVSAAFGALAFPDKRMDVTYSSSSLDPDGSESAFRRARPYLIAYMRRHAAMLVANRPPLAVTNTARCKLIGAPVVLNDQLEGALVLCKPASLPDFGPRESYVVKHAARMIATLLRARYDSATGLLLGWAAEEQAKLIMASETGDEHSVLYMDIDHLRIINDVLGLDRGDEAIAAIASLLQARCATRSAIAGRVIGGTFLVFLPSCDIADAEQWAEDLQRDVNALSVGLPSLRISLSSSCGISRVPIGAGLSLGVEAAGIACRIAKERGRNRCVCLGTQ